MKKIFEGEINGVKYTNEKDFMDALERIKSSGTVKSMSFQTQEIDDENQLDLFDENQSNLFDESEIKIDNLFPSMDQAFNAIESCTNSIELSDTLKEIENDLDERIKWLDNKIDKLDFRGVFDKINESKNKINVANIHCDNERRLLDKERYDLENALEELEEKEEKNDFMADLIQILSDYYYDIEDSIETHVKSANSTEPKNDVIENTGENKDIERLRKAFEILEKLWK